MCRITPTAWSTGLSIRARPAPSSMVAWPTGRAASERTNPLAGDFKTTRRRGAGRSDGIVDGTRVAPLRLDQPAESLEGRAVGDRPPADGPRLVERAGPARP